MDSLLIDRLRLNHLFKNISSEEMDTMMEDVPYKIKNYSKEYRIANKGDVCNRLIILLKGSVRGEMIDLSGKLIKIEDINAPRALAPIFLFGSDNHFPVEVTTNEDCEVIIFSRESVLNLFQLHRQFLENYLNISANYAVLLAEKVNFVSFKTIRQKITSYLLGLSTDNLDVVILDRSLQQLSDFFGVSRPSLSREFGKMEKEGLIVKRNKQVSFPNTERLKRLLR
jgi:CRP/FNR family transcriptional regulator, dissimilatory nitrate respiration regulator